MNINCILRAGLVCFSAGCLLSVWKDLETAACDLRVQYVIAVSLSLTYLGCEDIIAA